MTVPDVWLPTAAGFAAGILVAASGIWLRRRRRLHRAVAQIETWLEHRLSLCIAITVAVFVATLAAPAAIADNDPCRDDNACQGRQKKGCAEASAPCSDDDLNDNRVIVCLPDSHCTFSRFAPGP